MTVTVNDSLVSKNAKDRYLRWNEDLKRAEAKLTSSQSAPGLSKYGPASDYEKFQKAQAAANPAMLAGHTAAILTGTWNEGQPDSPCPAGSYPSPSADNAPPAVASRTPQNTPQRTTPPAGPKTSDRNPLNIVSSAFQVRGGNPSAKRPRVRKSLSDDPVSLATRSAENPFAGANHDGAGLANPSSVETLDTQVPEDPMESTHPGPTQPPRAYEEAQGNDVVTDTIGAIAIDLKGCIAAGSSSGGIGMKHTGRIGPAALVGIGTAVIPEDPGDPEQTSVAAVTSGTGEHMATTLASAKCAERLFHGTRRGPGGRNIEAMDEHALMEAFIMDDFMGHPGVKNQPSTGAIGVMAVKKDRSGIYFYFAHNTDSFALASMSSSEREPLCVMSRLGKSRMVAQGARKIRVE